MRPILILVLMNVVWSGSYVAAKMGLMEMMPLTLVFWRMGIAAALLTAWVIFRRIPLRIDRKAAVLIVTLGIVTAGSHLLWVTGLKYTNASDASLLFTFEPIWAIVLASVILKERFRWAMGAGLILAFAGLVILSNLSLATLDSLFTPSVAFGNLLIVGGMLCESFFSIIVKPLVSRCSPFVVIAGALLVTEAVLAVPVAASGGFGFPVNLRNIGVLFFLSVLCTMIGYVLWVKIMQRVPVNVMCYTIFVQPIVGPVIAMLVLGEVLEGRIIKGGVFLLAGMFVAVGSHIRAHRTSRAWDQCAPFKEPSVCPEHVE